MVQAANPALSDASLVIWTTTTWTIPGNRAMACHDEISYGIYQVGAVDEKSLAKSGEKLVLADDLADSVREAAKLTAGNVWAMQGP